MKRECKFCKNASYGIHGFRCGGENICFNRTGEKSICGNFESDKNLLSLIYRIFTMIIFAVIRFPKEFKMLILVKIQTIKLKRMRYCHQCRWMNDRGNRFECNMHGNADIDPAAPRCRDYEKNYYVRRKSQYW